MSKNEDRVRVAVFRLISGTPHTDDPRQRLGKQGILASVMSQFMRGARKVSTIPMEGFPASRVDLGWLKKRIEGVWRDTSLTTEEFIEALDSALGHMVQRLKRVKIHSVDMGVSGGVLLDIDLYTKDDHGYYGYQFTVKLDRGKV